MQRTVARLEQPTQPVVVLAMDVPIATKLEEKHVKLTDWPTGSVPAGSFDNIAAAIGQTLRQDVVAGEACLRSKLVDESQGQGLASLLTPGTRAMAVQVDPVVGVAGFVHPGDYVDVISTMQPDDETKSKRAEDAAWIARIVLQYVRVLAVGDKLSATGDKAEPLTAGVFTLAVTPEQSEKLALASQYGKLQLSLRSRVDVHDVETNGQSPAALLATGAPPKPAPAPVAVIEPARTRLRVREPQQHPVAAPPPAAPQGPVVEILRGTRVEERKLQSSTGASTP
jgi:pilus assembly protein CpaB